MRSFFLKFGITLVVVGHPFEEHAVRSINNQVLNPRSNKQTNKQTNTVRITIKYKKLKSRW